jgi:hypothetical protein
MKDLNNPSGIDDGINNELLIGTLQKEKKEFLKSIRKLVTHKSNLLLKVETLKEELKSVEARLLLSMESRAEREKKWQRELRRQWVSMDSVYKELAIAQGEIKTLKQQLENAKAKLKNEPKTTINFENQAVAIEKAMEKKQPLNAGWGGGLFARRKEESRIDRRNRQLSNQNQLLKARMVEMQAVHRKEIKKFQATIQDLKSSNELVEEKLIKLNDLSGIESEISFYLEPEKFSETKEGIERDDCPGIENDDWADIDNHVDNEEEKCTRESANKDIVDESSMREVDERAHEIIEKDKTISLPISSAAKEKTPLIATTEITPAIKPMSRLQLLRRKRRDLENKFSSWGNGKASPLKQIEHSRDKEKKRLRRENQNILLNHPVYTCRASKDDPNLINLMPRDYDD